MNSEKLREIAAEMRARRVNHGKHESPTLIAWADRIEDALSQQAESALAAVPDSGDAFYAGLYKKSAPMWHRLHDLAVSKGYDHVRFAIECAPVYKCDCMGARKVAIDMAGNTIPCECVTAANEAEPVRCEYCDGTGDVHRADGEWLGECKECDAAEPAPAQDERDAVYRDAELYGIGFMVDGVRVHPSRVTVQYSATRPAHTAQTSNP